MADNITIIYGYACNEGPNGVMQSGPTFTSRPQTATEADSTRRAAEAAFKVLGCDPVKCSVDFYGNDEIAKVTIRGGKFGGRVVTVRNF